MLIIRYVEYLLMYSLSIYMEGFLGKCLFVFFVHFKSVSFWILVALFLHIFWILTHYWIYSCKYYLPFWCLFFTFFVFCFLLLFSFLITLAIYFIYFCFCCPFFGTISIKTLLISMEWSFSPACFSWSFMDSSHKFRSLIHFSQV